MVILMPLLIKQSGNRAVEAIEASEVAEDAEVNEAAEVSKAQKITTEYFSVILELEFINLRAKKKFYFDV